MKKFIGILAIVVMMFVAVGCSDSANGGDGGDSSGDSGDEKAFNFGSATQGGFWYALSGAMSDEIRKTIPGSSVSIVQGGSVSNLMGLNSGKFQIGFSNGQTVPQALEGQEPFKEKAENVSWIATLYPNVFHIVVPEESDIHSIEDLKGKRVSPGIKGYSGELAFQKILDINGMSYDDLEKVEYVGTADGANLLRDGHIDAIVGMIAAPVSTFQELDTTLGIRLIPIPAETIAKMKENNPGFQEYVIEGGTYSNIKEDTKTIAAYTTLLVNNELSKETVYKLTKMVNENADKWKSLNKTMKVFDSEFSYTNKIGPVHPGALKYYKEVGAAE